ncbi:DNA (cytosine-5-)-methyltransferase [Bradyrhizobium barranii subsp. apii]|uniref:DNA (cytosine-5-)-methyltransferase n=1 Tax=Bradyrhizobium barranii TaxID=2992140 RepID=UPI001AA1937F|nr:DNA (cytosine-5-)-methyltransferase [Bradyrhizobium barranii]UPT96454.1 DNA (cytosine-5-)-methyltransferase [Bradyrhizobium barranii subsp. apii]
MSELRQLLRDAVARKSTDNDVALLLSRGRDSITVGIACHDLGKRVHAYTYELEGYPSAEREGVEAIARHFGWPLTVVRVPTTNLVTAFMRLAIDYRCCKKVQFETAYPMIHVVPTIEENEILTGWNADDNYGNTREYIFHQVRLTRANVEPRLKKEDFDAHRLQMHRELGEPGSQDTFWKLVAIAERHGKRVVDPYVHPAIRSHFLQFDHNQLSPLNKPVVREAFQDVFAQFPEAWVAKGVRLQKGGQVDKLFETLLNDPTVNRFEPRYAAVSPMCLRWGKEVEANATAFAAELAEMSMPPSGRSHTMISLGDRYQPYLMASVRRASSEKRFKVVSTFAGGGGSSTGYRLAGGQVVLVNEFVPEAARTYRMNYSDCIIDQRDIREISATDEAVAAFLAKADLKPRQLDILDGSPPCSQFSTAGRGISDQDIPRSYSDVMQNNIASLPFDLVDLAIRAQPKVFVCENVPAFASRAKEVFDRVLHALRFTGGRAYYANWMVLTASDFGVPQKRQRLFIIGVRKDVGDLIGIDTDETVRNVFPTPTHAGVTIRAAFEGLEQKSADIWPWTRAAMDGSIRRLIRLLPKRPTKPTRLVHIFPGYKNNYTLTRCCWDKPAPTMVVTSQRPDAVTGCIHPAHDRKFTLPELKRLTGLPDDFVLTGTLSQSSERICRMVPPLLTKAIAESVYAKVLLPYAEKSDDQLQE